MPTQVQFRRGTTAQNQNFTGAAGEISIDTSKKTIVVHDGTTAGGQPLAPNSAFDVANAAFGVANNVNLGPAFNVANAAFNKANNALANTSNVVFAGDLRVTGNVFVGTSTVTITNNSVTATSITATNLVVNGSSVPSGAVSNLAFDTANAAFGVANAGYAATNSVFGVANAAFNSANNVAPQVAPAFDTANASYGVANAGYAAVNSAFGVINAAFGIANNAYTATNGAAAFAFANGVATNTTAAFAFANGVSTNTTAAFGLTNTTYAAVNSAFGVINAAYGQANTLKTSANAYADLVGTSANNYAGRMANSANSYAASLTPDLSPPFNVANAAFDKANAANVLAYNTGIGANAYATVVGTSGNAYATVVGAASNTYANGTFVKLTAGQQTITGDVTITGNLSLLGNSTTISSNNLSVGDSLIYLAANNYSGTDFLDIGFVANYGNTTGANVHTGLVRDATNKQYYLFNGYDVEPANNTFVPGSNNMVNAVLVADFNTSNLTLGGANAITWIASGFGVANAAYGQANTLATSANAYAAAVGVSANAYAVTVGTSGNAFATAIGTAGNAYAVTVGTSGNNYAATVGTSSNNYAGVMANSVNAYTSATYSTLTQFGSVFGVANGAFGAANGKVASVTGTAGQIFSSGGTTPTVNLISTGVTATTYGGATQIPVLAVDAYGRITSASNVSVSGMDYAYVNTVWGVANAGFTVANSAYGAANGKVASVTGTSGQIFSSGGTAPTLNLISTGVTATTYGGATQIPVYTVDAYGRITSSANVALSAGDPSAAYNTANAAFGVANGAFAKANAAATAASPTFTGTVTFNANMSNQTLTDGVTISWDVSLGAVATVTLGGNRTMAAPTNLKVGTYILHVIQDATGSRTITWNAVFKWPAATAPTLTTTANARDIFSFICDGTNLYGTYVPDVR